MTELQRNYKSTNLLPGKDFINIRTLGLIDLEILKDIISEVREKFDNKIVIDEEQNVIIYGYDANKIAKIILRKIDEKKL